jgi:hypothetical protein
MPKQHALATDRKRAMAAGVQAFDFALTLGCAITAPVLERPRRMIQELLRPGVNLVGMHLIALAQVSYRLRASPPARSSPSAPASIFRLVLFVICRSVCCDETAPTPISQPVPNSGSTSTSAPGLQEPAKSPTLTPRAKIIGTVLPIARNLVFRMAIACPY